MALLLPHAPSIMELIQRCLADEERTESLAKLAFGLMGDLADCFPNGQLKQLLLQEWIVNELKNRRGLSPDVKKTMRWAKEVCLCMLYVYCHELTFLQVVKRATA